MELFTANGYESTKVEDVAAAAGVSRRTLFNYFRGKEDLALSGLAEQGDVIAARFAERPAGEGVWQSLRAAFQSLEEIQISPESRLEVMTLVFENESLRAGHAEKRARWEGVLTPLIQARLPRPDGNAFEARAIAAAAIACLQVASEEWVRMGGRASLIDLYDDAVRAVRTLG
jgi:AcrR family transcriptional regulator